MFKKKAAFDFKDFLRIWEEKEEEEKGKMSKRPNNEHESLKISNENIEIYKEGLNDSFSKQTEILHRMKKTNKTDLKESDLEEYYKKSVYF